MNDGFRVGQGFDVHAFDPERPLVLGGITIPDAPGLGGHSDADVLAHAIADALLGAAGLGDIGELFPAVDEWEGASSLRMLEHVAHAVSEAGWSIVNVDSTIVAEAPKLAPFKSSMQAALAGALATSLDRVSVKATTTDGLGATGRGEGIAAYAVALLSKT